MDLLTSADHSFAIREPFDSPTCCTDQAGGPLNNNNLILIFMCAVMVSYLVPAYISC